ncbi:MAG: hypothetical protein ACE5RN_08830 [Nitrosopumilaceae archaeon]
MKHTEIISDSVPDDVEINYDSILDNFELTICIICGEEVEAYWDSRYRGVRASCNKCEINWAES